MASRELLLLCLICIKSISAVCPDVEQLEPCTCSSDNIYCGGTALDSYKKLFDRLSKSLDAPQRHFQTLHLENQAITEIENEMFHDITFTEIHIKDAKNLRRILQYAFTGTAAYVEVFKQEGQSLIGDEDDHVADLFAALSSLINVKMIILAQTRLKYIPANAFNNVNQGKLTHLEINSGLIRTVGDRAFYYLNSLQNLHLERQELEKITLHAFDIEKASAATLEVHLEGNNLEDSSIAINAFTDTKRPLNINLSDNQLTHLQMDIFKPILSINANNKIDVTNNPFRCNCDVAWLVRNKTSYQNRVAHAVCKGNPHAGSQLFDLRAADYLDCPDV